MHGTIYTQMYTVYMYIIYNIHDHIILAYSIILIVMILIVYKYILATIIVDTRFEV